jgi:hypothetical protein
MNGVVIYPRGGKTTCGGGIPRGLANGPGAFGSSSLTGSAGMRGCATTGGASCGFGNC